MQSPGDQRAALVKKSKSGKSRFDRIAPFLAIVSLAILCFVGGAYVAEVQTPLYKKVLKQSFVGLGAYREKLAANWVVDGWYPQRKYKSGTAIYQPEKADHGATLYTSLGSSPSAALISMSGEVVHKWSLPFREAWPNAPHVANPMPEERIHWRRVHLFPNGDLLVNYTAIADTPNGYGLAKIDKNSRVIWKYSDRAHHDFDVDASGRVYTLTHRIRHEKFRAAPHLSAPMLEDSIVVLSADGQEIKRVAIFDAFANSQFSGFLRLIKSDEKGDHTHANTVHLISDGFAQKNGFCSAGDVMISLREPSLLAILNLEQGKVVWAARGIWDKQHDSDPLENGNVMVFDNKGNVGPGGKSRILEWNPRSGAVEWSFAGKKTRQFESLSRGSQQVLHNGNILVTDANNGRLFEVTRDKKIVWEYFNPQHKADQQELVGVVCDGVRVHTDRLQFLTAEEIAKIDRVPEHVAQNKKSAVR